MSSAADCWAVVVARTGPTAKSRLADVLGPDERSTLAQAMLADVLAACTAAPLASVAVVTDADGGRELAAVAGALAVSDTGTDMNGAVATGLRVAATHGARAVLVLPGDLPYLSADAVQRLLAQREPSSAGVLVAVDRAGSGTNGLLLWPPMLISPAFGVGSAVRHLAAARAAGVAAQQVQDPAWAFDLDLPADLAWLHAHPPAGETAAWLARAATRLPLSREC